MGLEAAKQRASSLQWRDKTRDWSKFPHIKRAHFMKEKHKDHFHWGEAKWKSTEQTHADEKTNARMDMILRLLIWQWVSV